MAVHDVTMANRGDPNDLSAAHQVYSAHLHEEQETLQLEGRYKKLQRDYDCFQLGRCLGDSNVRLDNHIPFRMRSTRLYHETGTNEDAHFHVVDIDYQDDRAIGDRNIFVEKKKSTGLVPSRVPSRHLFGYDMVWCQIYWRWHGFLPGNDQQWSTRSDVLLLFTVS